MTPQPTIKSLVVLVKLSDNKIHEVLLSDLVKKEIWKLIDGYGVRIHENDLSKVINF